MCTTAAAHLFFLLHFNLHYPPMNNKFPWKNVNYYTKFYVRVVLLLYIFMCFFLRVRGELFCLFCRVCVKYPPKIRVTVWIFHVALMNNGHRHTLRRTVQSHFFITHSQQSCNFFAIFHATTREWAIAVNSGGYYRIKGCCRYICLTNKWSSNF